MKLSEVQKVPVSKLKPNRVNQQFFKAEDGQYYDNLARDIKKRGILVPLVAKGDGTLLAGHNRLLIAKTLKINTVPVQFIEGRLTLDQEKEYIIKDNLLRRHLKPAERRELYRLVVDNFEERVMASGSSEIGVNQAEIAEKTGLNPKTVGYDLSNIRREKRKEQKEILEVDAPNEKEIARFKKSVSRMLNSAIVEKGSTIDQYIEITETALKRLKAVPR